MNTSIYSSWVFVNFASSWCRRLSAFSIQHSAFVLLAVAVLLLPASARAQFIDPSTTKASDAIKAAFTAATTRPSQSTVRILADNKPAALGIVVSATGHILTKASELSGDLTVRVRMGPTTRDYPATVTGLIEEQDLALLKIDLKDAAPLIPIAWADTKHVEVGQWVAATTITDRPLAVGVISVGPRKILGRPGLLGVVLGDADSGARILQVLPESAAEKVGLRVDDIITQLDKKPTANRDDFINMMHNYQPADSVELTVKRADKTLTLKATLTTTAPPTDPRGFGRFEQAAILGGPVSKRSTNFPLVLQHDTVLKPADCGGPLVDLDGLALGINIARAGRTESYTIPADILIPLIPQLIAGKFPPPPALFSASAPASPAATSTAPATRPATQPATAPPPTTLPRRKAA